MTPVINILHVNKFVNIGNEDSIINNNCLFSLDIER